MYLYLVVLRFIIIAKLADVRTVYYFYCIFLNTSMLLMHIAYWISSELAYDELSVDVTYAVVNINSLAPGMPYCLLKFGKHWAPSQYPKRRLFVRSRKVSKPRDLYLELSDRSEMCLSNFKAIRQFKVPISWLRDFTRSYEKTSFRILRRGPGSGDGLMLDDTKLLLD